VQTPFEGIKAVAGTGLRAVAQPPVRSSISISTTPGRAVACGRAASPHLLSSFRVFRVPQFYPRQKTVQSVSVAVTPDGGVARKH